MSTTETTRIHPTPPRSRLASPAGALRRCVLAAGAVSLALVLAGCAGKTAPEKARLDARERFAGNSAEFAAQQARQDFQVGNLKNALTNIEGAISLVPTEPAHHVMRGRVLVELNRLEAALQSFEAALRLDSECGDAHYYSGLVFQRWSDSASAYTRYSAALATDETNPDYFLAALETLIAMRRLDEAEHLIETSRQHFENNASVKRAQGHLSMLREEPAVAAEHFHRALLLMPEDKGIMELLVISLMKSGDHAKAEYYLDQLFKDPEFAARPDLRHLKALCLTAGNRLVEARSIYLKLIDEDPSDPQLWFELGSISFQLGDMRRVQNVVSRTIAVWPNRFESFMLRGMVHERENRLDAAIADYERACALRPAHEEPYILLGMALRAAGREGEAFDAFRTARMVAPNSARAQALLLAGVATEGAEFNR